MVETPNKPDMIETPKRPARIRLYAAAAAIVILAGAAAVYGIGGIGRNDSAATTCAATPAHLAALKPLATGELAGLVVDERPKPLPNLAFQTADGKPATLASLKGKTLLLNLWATWCVPCRQEMPALDRLQAALGGADFEVVAIALDMGSADKPREFLGEYGIKSIALRADPSGRTFQDMRMAGRAPGLPTSLLVDRTGCEMAYLPGPAEWDSAEGKAVVKAAIGG
jgi:thiol-disulfide isomerase/thioredoxin